MYDIVIYLISDDKCDMECDMELISIRGIRVTGLILDIRGILNMYVIICDVCYNMRSHSLLGDMVCAVLVLLWIRPYQP